MLLCQRGGVHGRLHKPTKAVISVADYLNEIRNRDPDFPISIVPEGQVTTWVTFTKKNRYSRRLRRST